MVDRYTRPPQGMDVEVAPVAPRGRSGGPRGPVVALVVLVVVVAGSIALAQAFPPDEPDARSIEYRRRWHPAPSRLRLTSSL